RGYNVRGERLLSGTMVTRVENASPGVGDVAARPRSIAVAGSTDGLVIKPRVLLGSCRDKGKIHSFGM
ncbi:TPA: hypothetical protein ACXJQA_006144, partial [Pseudomonas aeruginosa]